MVIRWSSVLFVMLLLSGCATFGFRSIHLETSKIMVSLEDPRSLAFSNVCVGSFQSEYLPVTLKNSIAVYYRDALVKKRIFGDVRFFDAIGRSSDAKRYYALKEGCFLFLEGEVTRLLATGGGYNQEVVIRVELWRLRDKKVVFSALQEGISFPGKDLDLFWSSSVGESSYPLSSILERAAYQFADLLYKELVKSLRDEGV